MLKADLHLHTTSSRDSAVTPELLIARCKETGINCVAVTDHNAIEGALALKKTAPFTIIVGEEIRTTHGEIIGYFLSERIPRGLSPEETISRIKGQGGLVCVPHPTDRFRPSALDPKSLQAVLPQVDIIEVFNARTPLSRDQKKARLLAQNNGLLASAGSDSHTPGEIGNAYVEMPEFTTPEEFKSALAQGTVHGKTAGLWIRVASRLSTMRRWALPPR
ncbi:MAG: PHP domain-containing protein [Dehalococcoidia bacterium]|nr:PHP domain-containing protein [Dehalococcoidia bacterium]